MNNNLYLCKKNNVMEFKAGDKILFLNEVGGGTISKILDSEMALVLSEDGFEIPILQSEIILDKSWNPQAEVSSSQPKTVQPVEDETPDLLYSNSADVNIYFAIVPKNPKYLTDEGFDVFLINDSNYFLYYTYHVEGQKDFKIINGEAEPNLKIHLTTIKRDDLKEDINCFFQCMFFDKRPFVKYPPLQKEIKIKLLRIFKEGAYKPNDFFDEKALIIPVLEDNLMKKSMERLLDEDVQKAKKLKQNIKKPDFKSPKKPDKKEVDLHLHQLLEDEKGMSDADKLQYQLDYFRNEMDNALKKGYPKKIVFIHGIGAGKLKHEIRNILQRSYKSCLFQDASYAEYGYGATLVLLRKPGKKK